MNKKGKHAWVSTHACRRVYPKMVSEFCLSLNCTVFPNNGLFPSCPKLCFKARLSRRPLIWKWIFMAHTNKTQFHKKGSALSLIIFKSESFWNLEGKYINVYSETSESWDKINNFLNRLSNYTNSVFYPTREYKIIINIFIKLSY